MSECNECGASDVSLPTTSDPQTVCAGCGAVQELEGETMGVAVTMVATVRVATEITFPDGDVKKFATETCEQVDEHKSGLPFALGAILAKPLLAFLEQQVGTDREKVGQALLECLEGVGFRLLDYLPADVADKLAFGDYSEGVTQ